MDIIDNDLTIGRSSTDDSIYPLEDMNMKFDKGFYTVYELKRKKDAKDTKIILDSDFQRENVWKSKRNSELVESVLMGLPLPIFYFSQDKYGRLIVVDGRQRLTALFKYMDNEYKLRGLKVLPDYNGMTFSMLSPILQTRIEDYQIQAHIILPSIPDRIKYDIFDRVNRGGMTLNKQEIRNALYQGKATKMLNTIVKSDSFIRATGNAFIKDTRMKGKYLVNRYIAIHLYLNKKIYDDYGNVYLYKGDLDDFLGRSLDCINMMNDAEVTDLERVAENTLDTVYEYMGSDAFRFRGGNKKTPVNMNIFETVMLSLEGVTTDLSQTTVKNKINHLISSDEFHDNLRNHRDSASNIRWRVNKALELRQDFIKK